MPSDATIDRSFEPADLEVARTIGHVERWSSVVRRFFSDRLVRGFGKLGAGEIVVRLSRLLATIVLARHLDAVEIGLAATALTCFELVRVLANNGLGQMVVRASEAELAGTIRTARRLGIAVCLTVAAIQGAVGFAIAQSTGRAELFPLIGCLAAVYLLTPFGLVQSWLLQREYKLGTLSGVNAAQVGADNALTAALAIAGFGPWAIVLPKLLTAPIWVIGMRAVRTHRPADDGTRLPVRSVVAFCAPVLASEILLAVRMNADKALVGAMLGLEALGLYFLAFNAGYGLTLVLTGALSSAAFPLLSQARTSTGELIGRFDSAVKRLALPICALILLQAAAVFVYVPLLFGNRWEALTVITSILCLSAVTKPLYDMAAQLLRANGQATAEFAYSALYTAILLASFAAALPFGLTVGVVVLATVSLCLQAVIALRARRLVERT